MESAEPSKEPSQETAKEPSEEREDPAEGEEKGGVFGVHMIINCNKIIVVFTI